MLEHSSPPACPAPDTAVGAHTMGDFIQAFADFVGPNSMGELPVVEVTEHEHQRPPDLLANGPRGTSDNPTTIVESIIEELLDPSACSKYIVQSILDELIAAVPCLAAPSPVVAPPPRLPSQPSRVVRGKVQPPTVPPASRPGRLTNQLLYMKRKVMPGIWAHKFTWPFKKPVDAIKLNLPDYHTIIKQPMDFGTVRKRLNNKYYWSASECQEDIRLVFSNCYIYNKPELDISIMGHTLEKYCESLAERMPQPEIDQDLAKAAVKRKGRPPGSSGSRRSLDGDYVTKRARVSTGEDLESHIPVAQVGSHMGAYGLAHGKSTKKDMFSDESDSDEEDDSVSEGELDDLETGRPPGARPSNHRPVPVPRTFQDERPGGLLTERKTIKNYCKYCDQAFLSKYVRDMHEKVKHGSGYISAEKPKKMPVIKKPKKEPKSLQILPIKTEPEFCTGPQDVPDFSFNPAAQFTDHDLLNFVDKKHQAMNKQAKKNQAKTPARINLGGGGAVPGNNIRIPDDMLFPVSEELLLKEGYMHNSSAPAPGYSHGNGATNGLAQQAKVQSQAPARAPRAPPRPSKAVKAKLPPVQETMMVIPPDSKYDLQKELGFMEPTFSKSVLTRPADPPGRRMSSGPPLLQSPQQLYLEPQSVVQPVLRPSSSPSQEALMMARNAMRAQPASGQHSPLVLGATYSPGPQVVHQRSTSLGYESLRSPEMQLAQSPQSLHRGSVEERSPGPFLPQQQRPAVIQENFRPTAVLKPPTSHSSQVTYTSPEPPLQQQGPRPIALESRSVIFPSKPLPKEALKQVQVMQAALSFKPAPTSKPIDVLAQTLQLSEIDGFDFTEEKDMPGLVSTQELTLGDLKHLRTETVTIPNSHMRLSQVKPVSNGHDKLEDLLDFSNITYQDVRQLIGPTENMMVYQESDGVYSEVIASGSQQTVMLQAQPRVVSQEVPFSSSQSFTLQSPSLVTSNPGSSMPTFTPDLVYSDMASLEPGTVYALQEDKTKREEKWWA